MKILSTFFACFKPPRPTADQLRYGSLKVEVARSAVDLAMSQVDTLEMHGHRQAWGGPTQEYIDAHAKVLEAQCNLARAEKKHGKLKRAAAKARINYFGAKTAVE